MCNVTQDIRFSLRSLRKSPLFVLTIVFTIALGIGASTALFSFIHSILLRPLAYPNSSRIAQIWTSNRGFVSTTDFADWKIQNKSFASMTFYRLPAGRFVNLSGNGAPERVRGVRVSGDFFSVLGVKPHAGRTFLDEEDSPGKNFVAVISEGLWWRRFGGATNIVGTTIQLDGHPHTIVGIISRKYPLPWKAEICFPYGATGEELTRQRHDAFCAVYALLRNGVSIEEAQKDLDVIAARLEKDYPDTNRGRGVKLLSLQEETVGNIRPALLTLFGAVGFVLLIACANVVNLLLVRAISREKEFAIRLSLGASRWDVTKQLLMDSALVSSMGGIIGILFAFWLTKLMLSIAPGDIPRLQEVHLDQAVMIFALAVTCLTGLAFGLVPAVHTLTTKLSSLMSDGDRSSGSARRQKLRGALVVAEFALATTLVVGAGLLVKSFLSLERVNPGFDPQQVFSASVLLPYASYSNDAQRIAFARSLLNKSESIAGSNRSALVRFLPFADGGVTVGFAIEGESPPPELKVFSAYNSVTPDYFTVMSIPVVKGRYFRDSDDERSQPVVIINNALAKKYFSGKDPIDKHITIEGSTAKRFRIVGVVADNHQYALSRAPEPHMFLPYGHLPKPDLNFVIRAESGLHNAEKTIRGMFFELDKELPIGNVRALSQMMYESTALPRFRTLSLTVLASIAVMLASVGIYGVISYSVHQRTKEIGIRMAVGAQPVDILKLVLMQGSRLLSIGVLLGLSAALALTRFMRSLLFEVSFWDPMSYFVVILVLFLVGVCAILIPAFSASKLSPNLALRVA